MSESQIAFILRQAEEGTVIVEVCRKAGINESDILQLAEEVRRAAAHEEEAVSAVTVSVSRRRLVGQNRLKR